MEAKQKKRFFTNHSKSSAMVVSLAIHAVLLIFALSFVAVTVIQKEDKKFESRQVTRPRMPPKKLQVPVKVKKQKKRPKLRQRIVVNSTVNRNMPDIKMPEISGIKGGLGAVGGAGLGDTGGIGFSMPEIEVFGVKSKGEKVFLILDTSAEIMYDELGGIAGYTLIKNELIKILGSLPSTTLFNVAVYDHSQCFVLFPNLVSANKNNVDKADKWLEPLNKVHAKMGKDQYGPKTLGPGGSKVADRFVAEKIENPRLWYRPSALAMKQQADAVFLLGSTWGVQWTTLKERPKWGASAKKKWDECHKKGLKLLEEENKERIAKGEPPRVIGKGSWEINKVYFPGIEFPPIPERYYYTPKDFREAFSVIREKHTPSQTQSTSGIKKSKKAPFSFNIIQFMPKDAGTYQARYDNSVDKFKKLTAISKGKYRSIKGMEGIKSSISGSSGN